MKTLNEFLLQMSDKYVSVGLNADEWYQLNYYGLDAFKKLSAEKQVEICRIYYSVFK